jgi:hypothetical protein
MDDRLTEFRKKIASLNLTQQNKFDFYMLVNNIEISDKKIKTFLNIKLNKVAIGFLYRLVVSSAYRYGVPKVYIDRCINAKNDYEISKKFTSSVGRESSLNRKVTMHREYSDLLKSTVLLAIQKNTRKEKITRVLEKIADKNI